MTDRHFANVNGALASEIRSFDWASTDIGPVDQWPMALKTVVALMLDSPFPMAVVAKKGLVLFYNDAFVPILGNKERTLGRSFADVWSEAWSDIAPIVDKALKGEATFVENFPLQVSRGFGENEQAFFTFSYSPLRDEFGEIIGFVDTVIETTDTVHARAQGRELADELGHRLKNTLALVQALASQTLSQATPKSAVKAFDARLLALSKAHDLLVRESWVSARIRAIVEGALSLHIDESRYQLSGPDLTLGPRGSLSLAMLLHELATNAVKYGALSIPNGRIEIVWRVDGAELSLEWRELDGPQVVPPTKKGLGSRLISSGLVGTGSTKIDYNSSGLKANFRAPLAMLRDS